MFLVTRSVRLVCLGAAVFFLGLVAGPLMPRAVNAQISACQSDPVVLLSNGLSVTMAESIYDVASDVSHISYELHAPVGTSVVSITTLGDISSNLQSFAFYADENTGNYDTYTTVTTATEQIRVAATTTVATVSASTGGPSGQPLHNHVHVS